MKKLIVIIVLAIASVSFAQDAEKKIEVANNEIQAIQAQISVLNEVIQELQNKISRKNQRIGVLLNVKFEAERSLSSTGIKPINDPEKNITVTE